MLNIKLHFKCLFNFSVVFLITIILCLISYISQAQDYKLYQMPRIVSIDREMVFTRSRIGQKIIADTEREFFNLNQENEFITATLSQEEKIITEERKTDRAEVFQKKIKLFDKKVKRLRAEHSEKANNIQQAFDAARNNFFTNLERFLRQYMNDHKIIFILDRKAILVNNPNADITDTIIDMVDREGP